MEELLNGENADSQGSFDIADFVHGPKAELVNELTLEFLKIKKDVDYLSKKIGLHEMHINRIKKEIEEISTPNK